MSTEEWGLPPAEELYGRYVEIPTEALLTDDMTENWQMDEATKDYVRLDYVYFVTAEPAAPFIKIGFTGQHPKYRLLGLQAGSPVPLRPLGLIRGNREYENDLLETFAAYCSHSEWFRAEPPLLEFIERYALPWSAGDAGFMWMEDRKWWDRRRDFIGVVDAWKAQKVEGRKPEPLPVWPDYGPLRSP